MKQLSGVRLWLVAAGAFLLWGGIAFLAGFASQRVGREADAQRYAALETRLQTVQGEASARQAVSELLSSNVWVCRAAVALDNRNFGVANTAIVNAVESLNRVNAPAAGIEAQSLRDVIEGASAIQISVATNLSSQRNQLIRLENQVGELVARSTPPAASNGAP